MSEIKGNTGKWKSYVSGRLFSSTGGQNLNIDLQENLADELDGMMSGIVGTAVVGGSSWQVLPTTNVMEVKVSPGQGYFLGQRGSTSTDFTVTPQIPVNTTGTKIYIELDPTATFDVNANTWPVRVGWVGPTATIPTNSLLLALVNTTASAVIQQSQIIDQRRVVETDYETAASIDDHAGPTLVALSTRSRLGQLANQIRLIILGGPQPTSAEYSPGGWGTPVNDLSAEGAPWSLLKLSRFFSRDQAPTGLGHRHRGTEGASGDGPRIEARYVESAATAGSSGTTGITATRVQAALEQLDQRKLALNGSQPMSGLLTLSGDPIDSFHAATRQFVLAQIAAAITTINSQMKTSIMASTELKSITGLYNVPSKDPSILTPNQPNGNTNPWNHPGLSILSKGGVIKFEASSPIIMTINPEYNVSGQKSIELTFNFKRGTTILKTEKFGFATIIGTDQSIVPITVPLQVPIFYDQPGTGTWVYNIDIIQTIGQFYSLGNYDGPRYWYAIET